MMEIKNRVYDDIRSNLNKNIFFLEKENLSLGKNLYKYLLMNTNIILEDEEVISLSEYTLSEIISIIIETNQYVLINQEIKASLYNIIYKNFQIIFNKNPDKEYGVLINKFQKELIYFLGKIDELKAMDNKKADLELIPCSEYMPKYQLETLNININNIVEPILDIGCGSEAYLTRYLNRKGLDAIGIDRYIKNKESFLIEKSWFDYEIKKEYWGTIISHLSFTNHFKREHYKKGNGHILYAKKYIDILEGLKHGGKFYYAPNISFIEDILDKNEYGISNSRIKQAGNDILSTVIIRKK